MSIKLDEMMGRIGNNLMNTIQMGLTYEQWGKEFSYEEVIRSYERIKDQAKEIVGNPVDLSDEDLKNLGFKKWDEDSEIRLIPIWAYDLIPDGTELTSIGGSKTVKGTNEIDLDVRFGCIAYGFVPKAPETTESA